MLATAQMLGSSGLTVVVILGGIVATQIAPRPSLATVPLSLAIVATALTTIPASLLMRRIGRRAGFIVGASVGLVGGLVAAQAVIRADFLIAIWLSDTCFRSVTTYCYPQVPLPEGGIELADALPDLVPALRGSRTIVVGVADEGSLQRRLELDVQRRQAMLSAA